MERQSNEICHGWTVEQELALKRAYSTVNPTPRFWKEVARLVPGKSAQDCFDKIESDHPTPPKRSRGKNDKKSSPIPVSPTKLLDSGSKKLTPRKTNVPAAKKAVRKLFQNHHDQDKEDRKGVDLFSLIEHDGVPSLDLQEWTTFGSPSPPEPSVLTKCTGTSPSSASKKRMSRTSSLSPPVLKPIKNKALHEKYLDHLHRRDAKREAESRRNAKRKRRQYDDKPEENAVKVAKNAQFLDALDAFNRLQIHHSLNDDDDDAIDYGDEGEDEDEEQE